MKTYIISLFFSLSILSGCKKGIDSSDDQNPRPNILFIAVDDLRPELGCYGAEQIVSPNIDKLASEGILFKRAYCNVPVCGASRASLLTGLKPTYNRFVSFDTWADKDVPGISSLPQHFKNNGYYTISNGKVFHHRSDMRDSWNEPPWKEEPQNWRDYISEENLRYAEQNNGPGLPYEMMDVPDSAYQDGRVADKTIADLMRVKDMDKPFFLAVGFFKPHLPFNAPERYWDLYDPRTINLPYNYFRPENAPDAAIHNFGELRQYHKVTKEGPLDPEMAKTLIRGYYASVSYTDTQIGKVLHALDTLGLKDNTIVILWGDHGWQLAEHTLWCKHSNFNLALRVPLIIRAPGYTHGGQTEALVEFIDIYPTLCDLANINLPDHLHGSSFKYIMKNPSESGKKAIYSRFHNGESIKTDRYLYSEWHNASKGIYARMLYDHVNDPDENINIAELPEMSGKVDELSALLKDEMEKAIKPINQAAYDK